MASSGSPTPRICSGWPENTWGNPVALSPLASPPRAVWDEYGMVRSMAAMTVESATHRFGSTSGVVRMNPAASQTTVDDRRVGDPPVRFDQWGGADESGREPDDEDVDDAGGDGAADGVDALPQIRVHRAFDPRPDAAAGEGEEDAE